MYYVLSGDDFTLNINDPKEPKIVCLGNNQQRTQTYGAVLSLYITALIRLVNKKNNLKSSLIFDEFPTIYFNGIDHLIATARSNKVSTTLAVQDATQLKFHYGKDQADVIVNIVGNMISGQVTGESAKHLSETFGKILQDRENISINRNDVTTSHSKQLDPAIPIRKISTLSSGEFVGIVSDDPMEKIKQKMFCAEIINDHRKLSEEQKKYTQIPEFFNVTPGDVAANFLKIKEEVKNIVDVELQRMMDSPELSHLYVKIDH